MLRAVVIVCLGATAAAFASDAAPYYPPDPAGVPQEFICAWRALAHEYASKLRPDAATLAFDALQLGPLCNITSPPQAPPARPAPPLSPAASEVYVDGVHGDDAAAGTLVAPLRTLPAGIAKTRGLPRPVTLFVRAATYRLAQTLELGAADSDLTISSYNDEEVWLSGAVTLPALTWTPYNVSTGSNETTIYPGMNDASGCAKNSPSSQPCGCSIAASIAECQANFTRDTDATAFTWHDAAQGVWALQCCLRHDGFWEPYPQAGHTSGRRITTPTLNIWSAVLPAGALPAGFIPAELRVDGARAGRARIPNADPERDLFPVGWITSGGTKWAPPKPAPPITPVSVTNAAIALRNSSENAIYSGALGGPCHVFDPPFSYWCSEHPAGGGGFQYYVPGGAILQAEIPPFDVSPISPPIFQVWRAAHWANWMLEIESYDSATQTVVFGKGGFQGARGGPGSDYFLEGALPFLDVAGEWHLDVPSNTLFYYPNSTDSAPPASIVFEAPMLTTLIRVNASQAAPATGITLSGLGFRDTAPTYLEPHAVPSGGDWALERIASVFAEGTLGFTVRACNFTRIGGNALMLSGFARDAVFEGNAFRWTGASAMIGWGRTDETSQDGTLGWDATGGDFPINTTVRNNLASEIGVWSKQNSCWSQFKTALTTLEGNLCFNVARAGFNFNDGLGGGDEVHDNLIFNTNRESADHGPINSFNMLVGNYGGGNGCVDNDDGSLWFMNNHNVAVYGHQKFKVGAITNYDNVLAYISDLAGHWNAEGESGYAPNGISGNKAVFAPDTNAVFHDCSWTGSYSHDNALYGPGVVVSGSGCKGTLTLAEWQALDPSHNDVGSTYNATRPWGWEIVAWGRPLLGL